MLFNKAKKRYGASPDEPLISIRPMRCCHCVSLFLTTSPDGSGRSGNTRRLTARFNSRRSYRGWQSRLSAFRLASFQSLKTEHFGTKLRSFKIVTSAQSKRSIVCANPVLSVGRRASRQGRIPLSPLNFHLDPPPGSRSLPLGFRARKMFTRKISSGQFRFDFRMTRKMRDT